MPAGWIILIDLQDRGEETPPSVTPWRLDTQERVTQVIAFLEGGPEDPINPPVQRPRWKALYAMNVRDAPSTSANKVGSLAAGYIVEEYEGLTYVEDSIWIRIAEIEKWVCTYKYPNTYMVKI
jgi:hypothetical protein